MNSDDIQQIVSDANRLFYLIRKHGNIQQVGKFEKIGSGHFSRVYLHADYEDVVVKLSGPAGWGVSNAYLTECAREYSLRYDAWPVYARYVRDNPHKHFPVVYSVTNIKEGFNIGIIKRYDDLGGALGREAAWALCHNDIFHQLNSWEEGSFLNPVQEMINAMGLSIDVHTGNVMWCTDNNDWVLTDPFSFIDGDQYAQVD